TWGFPGNFQETTTKDSLFHLEAKDSFAPAFGLGALYKVGDDLTVGAQWTSELSVNAAGIGTAVTSKNLVPPVTLEPADQPKCAAGGTAEALKGCINIALPMMAGVG